MILKSSRIILKALNSTSTSSIKINIEARDQQLEPPIRISTPRSTNKQFPNMAELKRGPSENGSVRTPIQGVPGRSLGTTGDGNFNTVIAKLNVITSQLTANESRFEANRIQIDEQQIQLDALQRQSVQIVDLLETLTRNIANLVQNYPGTPQTRNDHVVYEPVPRLNHIERSEPSLRIPKVKKSRGRPRTRCVSCKKGTIIEDSGFCGDCLASRTHLDRSNRSRTVSGDKTHQSQGRSIPASPMKSVQQQQQQQEHHPHLDQQFQQQQQVPDIARAAIEEVVSGITQKASIALVSASLKTAVHTEPATDFTREITPPRLSFGSRGRFVQQTPHSRSRSREPRQKHANGASTSGTPAALPQRWNDNTPFAEDSFLDATEYSDIMDTENLEATTSGGDSYTSETSVPESISLDAIVDDDTEMKEADDDLEEGEILSQEYRSNPIKHPSPRLASGSARPQYATTSANPKPNLRVPVATMASSKSYQYIPQLSVGRSRKPIPSGNADGDEGHHKLTERTNGPSWSGVKRSY